MISSRHWRLPWSVQVDSNYGGSLGSIDEWTVRVWRLDDPDEVELEIDTVNISQGWYGWSQAIVFRPAGRPTPGRYRASVTGPEFDITWEIEMVACE